MKCMSCHKSYVVEVYHAGFSGMGFLYCDKDATVVTWDEIMDKKYRKLVREKVAWSLSKRQKKRVENALKPCPCGGRFRFDNDLHCPTCGKPLAGGISERDIYVCILDKHVDGEKVNIWKTD